LFQQIKLDHSNEKGLFKVNTKLKKCWFNKSNARTKVIRIYSFFLRLYYNYSDTKTKSIFIKLKEKEKLT